MPSLVLSFAFSMRALLFILASLLLVSLLACSVGAESSGEVVSESAVASESRVVDRSGPVSPARGLLDLGLAGSVAFAEPTVTPTLSPIVAATVPPLAPGEDFIVGVHQPTVAPSVSGTWPVAGVGPALEERWIVLPDGWYQSTCDDALRAAILESSEVSPAVVAGLVSTVQEVRPDCSSAVWSPVADLTPGCEGHFPEVAGTPVAESLIDRRFALNNAYLVPTARDSVGNVIVHFSSGLAGAGSEQGGCWYYQSSSRSWSWLLTVPGRFGSRVEDSAVDPLLFLECAYQLQQYLGEVALEAVASDEPGGSSSVATSSVAAFGFSDVARLQDQVRVFHAEQCGDPLWDAFPRSAGWAGCGELTTGLHADLGVLVVNWHERFLALNGEACWRFDLATASWESEYVDS